MKWEYYVCELKCSNLNELGQQGWELVAITETYRQWENSRKGYTDDDTETCCYFKRPIIEARS